MVGRGLKRRLVINFSSVLALMLFFLCSAKDLIKRLLVVNPTERLTPQEAMQHPWMVSLDLRNLFQNII